MTFNQNQLFETRINWPKLVPNNIYPLSAKQKWAKQELCNPTTEATLPTNFSVNSTLFKYIQSSKHLVQFYFLFYTSIWIAEPIMDKGNKV